MFGIQLELSMKIAEFDLGVETITDLYPDPSKITSTGYGTYPM